MHISRAHGTTSGNAAEARKSLCGFRGWATTDNNNKKYPVQHENETNNIPIFQFWCRFWMLVHPGQASLGITNGENGVYWTMKRSRNNKRMHVRGTTDRQFGSIEIDEAEINFRIWTMDTWCDSEARAQAKIDFHKMFMVSECEFESAAHDAEHTEFGHSFIRSFARRLRRLARSIACLFAYLFAEYRWFSYMFK